MTAHSPSFLSASIFSNDQETSIVIIDHPTEKRLAFLERAIAEAGREVYTFSGLNEIEL